MIVIDAFCRDVKDMNANQAKVSAETVKEVMNDKTLKTKGEKDRRLKEKKANNIKKFMDDRKNITIKQAKEKEKLKLRHEKELKEIDKDLETVSHLHHWVIKKFKSFFLFKCVMRFQVVEQWKTEAAHQEMGAKCEFYV